MTPCRIQPSKESILYAVRFSNVKNQELLIVSCNEGVVAYKWSDCLQQMKTGTSSDDCSAISSIGRYQLQQPSYGTATVTATVTAADVDEFTGTLYAATGSGAYKYDMETEQMLQHYSQTNMRGRGCRDRLNTIRVLSQAGGRSTVLTGGEDGGVAVWDGQQDKLVEQIDCRLHMKRTPSIVNTVGGEPNNGGSSSWNGNDKLWISSMDARSESDWWVVCGGMQERTSPGTTASATANAFRGRATSHTQPQGGFVASLHAPTRSLVAACITRETPQCVRTTTTGGLITVGNECVVSHWSALPISRLGRAWCTTPTAYALAIREEDDYMAVAGLGSSVDVFYGPSAKALSLSTL